MTFDEALRVWAYHTIIEAHENAKNDPVGTLERLGLPEIGKPYVIRNVTFDDPEFDRHGGCPTCDYGNQTHMGKVTIYWSYGTKGYGKARKYVYTIDYITGFLRTLFDLTEPTPT